MEPNATYSPLTANMIFDPKSPLAGVAGPIFDVMSTYFVPTLNGEMDPAEAVDIDQGRAERHVSSRRLRGRPTRAAPSFGRSGRCSETARKDILIALALVAPFVAIYALVFVYPTIQMFRISFTDAPLIGAGQLGGGRQLHPAHQATRASAPRCWNTAYFVADDRGARAR